MRSEPVTLDELKDNFEAALTAAAKGIAPTTAKGFDGPTFKALSEYAAKPSAKSRRVDAQRAFGNHLSGKNFDDWVASLR